MTTSTDAPVNVNIDTARLERIGSSEILIKRKNILFAKTGLFYAMLPIKIKENVGKIFHEIILGPPALVDEGLVFFNKKFYKVSKRDLIKGIIYATQATEYKPTDADLGRIRISRAKRTATAAASGATSASDGSTTGSGGDEPGSGSVEPTTQNDQPSNSEGLGITQGNIGRQELEIADSTFENQIRALYDPYFTEDFE